MQGKIISLKENIAQIEILCDEHKDKTQCSVGCTVCRLFASAKQKTQNIVTAENKINASVGQTVEVELKSYAQLTAIVLLFVFPILVFLIASGVLSYMEFSALVIFAGAVIAVCITLLLLKLCLKNKVFYDVVKITDNENIS